MRFSIMDNFLLKRENVRLWIMAGLHRQAAEKRRLIP